MGRRSSASREPGDSRDQRVLGDGLAEAAALAARDFAAVGHVGHDLNGVAAGFGFASLAEVGRALEDAAGDASPEAVEECMARIGRYLADVRIVYGRGEAMTPRFFGPEDIERALPMRACIDVMASALGDLAAARIAQPLRTAFVPPGAAGLMVWMPAHRAAPRPTFATKLLCVMPDNPARGLDSHQGVVALFDGDTGELRALLDAPTITGIRTAAVSALATRLLARDDASELAIIGTGYQAERHLEAIPLVRPIQRVRVAGRTAAKARAFVERQRSRHAVELVAAAGTEEAVRGADVVVTVTSSATPVVELGWLRAGAHVNAVGASQPPARELAAETVAACALFTDRLQSLDGEAAEWQDGLARGLFVRDHLRAELGELVLGTRPGRRSAGEITVFRSLGLATEDMAAAEHVLANSDSSVGT